MAVLASTYLNLIDVMMANERPIGEVINVLKKKNRILDDAVAQECNDGTSHEHSIMTGLPTPAWGRLYQGIPQSKATWQTVKDTTGFLEGRSGVDTRALERSKNPGALRLVQADAHLEAMSQEMATGLFYHDTATTPEKFKGLAARYGSIGGAGSGNQIVDAGGTGSDNTSIWFVNWGEGKTTLLYPENSKAGFQRSDKGEQRVTDANGDPYYVKEELFRWDIGVAVEDWRYNARIANLDVSDMLAGTVDVHKFLIDAYYKLQSTDRDGETGRLAIYMNRTVMSVLDKLDAGIGSTGVRNALRLTPMELEGKMVKTWRGIPIREVDALLNTEARVV